MSICGLLNIDKPAGVTSRDVVNVVQRIARPAKVGHAGTLDPLASGVLVVCVGWATRLIEYVQQMPKHYRATFVLGQQSPTDDIEGEITQLVNPPIPTLEEVSAALPDFLGEIMQRPPAYSAIKVQGRRAYDLARRGKTPELKARPVTVHHLDILRYEYPELQLAIRCGSGTYVRSLGRDIAEQLGTAAVMSALQRTEIGSFTVNEAVTPEQITKDSLQDLLLPPGRAVEVLPHVQLNAMQLEEVSHGRAIQLDPSLQIDESNEVAAVDTAGNLAAIMKPVGDSNWRPLRNFLRPGETNS